MAPKIKPKTALTQKRLEEKIDKLILSAKLNERNADEDILMQSFHHRLGVNIEYAYDVNEKEIDKIVRALDRTFGMFEADDDKINYVKVDKTTSNGEQLKWNWRKACYS